MHDFEVTDSDSKRRRFADIIGTAPVIVAHSCVPVGELPFYKYMDSLGHRVVLVISGDNPMLHIMKEAHDLGLETYTDPDCNLISWLREEWSLQPSVSALVKLLRFQMLCIDGEVSQSWIQHMSWQEFLADREAVKAFCKKFGAHGVTWMREQDKNSNFLWSGPGLGLYNRQLFGGLVSGVEGWLKHSKLMPNKELEDRLNQHR